ncbi:hypothetical protein [Azospirillum sp. SYSU D00513]|uniref:hypothetical protein n=1 Tax=Azospirillum sp. SYSU D00513 TaxID=2812561 RepID=UPI001A973C9E|nr:hypothetical protein [Azospirillum sp. SYSU D00513]
MAYITSSHLDADRSSSGILKTISEFVSAWVEASAAYATYSALSTKSNAQLAARGLHRQDIARSAMDLPALIRE